MAEFPNPVADRLRRPNEPMAHDAETPPMTDIPHAYGAARPQPIARALRSLAGWLKSRLWAKRRSQSALRPEQDEPFSPLEEFH